MRTLYPPIEPFDSFMLPVSKLHTINVEQSGNEKAKPVLFVHGGPGGGIDADHRRYFHPEKWRAVLFDQRGSGKSTPFGSIEENTTWDLVADIERIRERLGIESWHVFGGSWGSTLALAYAITHPNRVKGLVLRGIFLLRKSEINWFYQHGASEIYPDEWEEYLAPIPQDERKDLLTAYHRRITGEDKEELRKAAKSWSKWEGATSKLIQDPNLIARFSGDEFSYAFARIECHYFKNNGFFETDNFLIENISRIRHIPGVIVQGRYDMPCPVRSAWDLHRAWPESRLHIVPDAGHSASEKGIMDFLVQATDEFADAA